MITKIVLAFSFFLIYATHSMQPAPYQEQMSELRVQAVNGFIPETRIERFSELAEHVEEHLVLRQKAIRFYDVIENAGESIGPVHRQQLQWALSTYAKLRAITWSEIDELKWYVDKKSEIKIIDDSSTALIHDVRNHHRILPTLFLNPMDDVGKKHVIDVKKGLAFALLLYDNFLVAIAPYQNSTVRNSLNEDNPDHESLLNEIVESAYSFKNAIALNRALIMYRDIIRIQQREGIKIGKFENYLDGMIEGSYLYNKGGFTKSELILGKHLQKLNAAKDFVLNRKNGLMNEVSKAFGNTVGLVQSRHGKLIAKDDGSGKFKIEKTEEEIQVVIDDITSNLKPLDVLFEKTPFRLTDRFIPGHWGHVAIWAGTQHQLENMFDKDGNRVWDLLNVWEAEAKDRLNGAYAGPTFQNMVESGHLIIEALRPGVEINTVHHFLDIDDLGVIRPIDMSLDDRIHFLRQAFTQLGKEYDFNFDVSTAEKIVCSEIAVWTFDKYKFPTTNTMNRDTISPDEVAILALPDEDGSRLFEPVMIYHDGKRLPDEHIEFNYEKLLKTDYDSVKF